MYDGPHEVADQHNGIVLAQPALSRSHILILEDWNWPAVRRGTLRALRDANLTVRAAIEIRTRKPPKSNSNTKINPNYEAEGWWNGYFLAALQKRSV
jgi:hypothetical protein